MKIVKLTTTDKVDIPSGKEKTNEKKKEDKSPSADEIVVKLRSQDFPRLIKDEMQYIQREVSITQAQLDAIYKISNLIKGVKYIDENLRDQIRRIYETSTYGETYLLENIKNELFAEDLEGLVAALNKEVTVLSKKIEDNRKKTNALLVKFQNINTFIDTISNEQINNTARLIASSASKVQRMLNLSSENVIKFLSN